MPESEPLAVVDFPSLPPALIFLGLGQAVLGSEHLLHLYFKVYKLLNFICEILILSRSFGLFLSVNISVINSFEWVTPGLGSG